MRDNSDAAATDRNLSAGEPGKNLDDVRPKSPGLRLLAVVSTVLLAVGIGAMVVALARGFGIDPKDLQGTRFVPTLVTLTVLLACYVLQVLIVVCAQRFLHQRPFLELGFRAPAVKHLLIGFGVGLAAWTAPLATGRRAASSPSRANPRASLRECWASSRRSS